MGYRRDVIHTKAFQDYIRDHVGTWFNCAQRKGLGRRANGRAYSRLWLYFGHFVGSRRFHRPRDISWISNTRGAKCMLSGARFMGRTISPKSFRPVCLITFYSLCTDCHYPTTFERTKLGIKCLFIRGFRASAASSDQDLDAA